ncbi:putative uncharacterized protein SPANXA2-OT1 [Plecturocebus cupreus]
MQEWRRKADGRVDRGSASENRETWRDLRDTQKSWSTESMICLDGDDKTERGTGMEPGLRLSSQVDSSATTEPGNPGGGTEEMMRHKAKPDEVASFNVDIHSAMLWQQGNKKWKIRLTLQTEGRDGVMFYYPGWSAMVQSQLTATSTSRVQAILLPQPPDRTSTKDSRPKDPTSFLFGVPKGLMRFPGGLLYP